MTHENKEPILNEVVFPLTTGMLPWFAPGRDMLTVNFSMLGSYEEEIAHVMVKDYFVSYSPLELLKNQESHMQRNMCVSFVQVQKVMKARQSRRNQMMHTVRTTLQFFSQCWQLSWSPEAPYGMKNLYFMYS